MADCFPTLWGVGPEFEDGSGGFHDLMLADRALKFKRPYLGRSNPAGGLEIRASWAHLAAGGVKVGKPDSDMTLLPAHLGFHLLKGSKLVQNKVDKIAWKLS